MMHFFSFIYHAISPGRQEGEVGEKEEEEEVVVEEEEEAEEEK